jgi:hypothetical protein
MTTKPATAKPLKLALVDEDYQVPPDAAERSNEERKEITHTAIAANGIKEGRRRAKAEHTAAMDATITAHAADIARIEAKQEARMIAAQQAAFAHGWHKAAWIIGLPALVMGAATGVFALIWMQEATFDAAARNARENAITGAIVSGNRPGP